MVAMGGGAEIPQRGRDDRELLLITSPQPEDELKHFLIDLKEEFPNLDTHYIQIGFDGKAEVPKGNLLAHAY